MTTIYTYIETVEDHRGREWDVYGLTDTENYYPDYIGVTGTWSYMLQVYNDFAAGLNPSTPSDFMTGRDFVQASTLEDVREMIGVDIDDCGVMAALEMMGRW